MKVGGKVKSRFIVRRLFGTYKLPYVDFFGPISLVIQKVITDCADPVVGYIQAKPGFSDRQLSLTAKGRGEYAFSSLIFGHGRGRGILLALWTLLVAIISAWLGHTWK